MLLVMLAPMVKFQTFQAIHLATEHATQAAYQQKCLDNAESQLKMLQRLELSPAEHLQLIDYCDQKQIEFLSTAFDLLSIDLLASFKIKRWKIPSGEITNLPYLREIGRQGKPVILSTGMADLSDIESAIEPSNMWVYCVPDYGFALHN